MIIVFHIEGRQVVRVQEHKGNILEGFSKTPLLTLRELARIYPKQWLVWCDAQLEHTIDFLSFKNALHHPAIMVSDLRLSNPISKDLHYIEESPFAKVNLDVTYPTWQMSSAIGAIYGGVLDQIASYIPHNLNLEYSLNSIAKKCQSQGLRCYHSPLVKEKISLRYKESTINPYVFAASTFKKRWLPFLFLCHIIFEKRFPIRSLIQGLFQSKSQIRLDINKIKGTSSRTFPSDTSVDVIIPTMGRATYLYDVLKDFSVQTVIPNKVIIVEQNADPAARTALPYLTEESWPFKIVHHFIHQTGACNARNIALKETSAAWVFFADDDIRLDSHTIQNGLDVIKNSGVNGLAMSCLQHGEQKFFDTTRQWFSFPSGASMVQGALSRKLFFDTAYEHGYGEDADYGMQLRNAGVDILYHPEIELLHLKAPIGGFRHKIVQPWESEAVAPKPSPTVMRFRLTHSTAQQLKGYKLRLLLGQLNQKKPLNVVRFIKHFKKGWNTAVTWAKKLESK